MKPQAGLGAFIAIGAAFVAFGASWHRIALVVIGGVFVVIGIAFLIRQRAR